MNYVEKCLYDYPDNIALIEALNIELQLLSSVHGLSYEAHAINSISDPVAMVTTRIMSLERKITKMVNRTRPVERLLDDFRYKTTSRISQMDLILRLRYFKKQSVNDVLRQGAISYPTYWRRNQELLQLARKYLAEQSA